MPFGLRPGPRRKRPVSAPGPAGDGGPPYPSRAAVPTRGAPAGASLPRWKGAAPAAGGADGPVPGGRRGARRGRRPVAAALALVLAASLAAGDALAQGRGIPVVRDAETEDLLRDYADPIFRVAGLGRAQPEIVLIDDSDFNAFIADNRRIFLNTGVIEQAETPGEVIGVLAHETGHIAGNHLARLRQALARAQAISVLTTLVGVGAIAAGASAGGSSNIGGGGAAAIIGGGTAAQRSLLAYQRSEERAADAAALRYLERTGQSAKGMLDVFSRLADQQLFSARYADPYALSHPMARDRLAQLQTLARQSPHFGKPDPAHLQLRHDMVRAKIAAFTRNPRIVQSRYPRTDQSLPARYARAIVATRTGRPRDAAAAIDALIRSDPDNPYFWELKGQAWLEAGQPARAVEPLRRAVSLAPRPGLMRIMLGHALVSTREERLLPEAIRELKRGLAQEPNTPLGYRALGLAYARSGEPGLADVASAQAMMMAGNVAEAKRFATRAQGKLKRGTPGWLQAEDILQYTPPRLTRG